MEIEPYSNYNIKIENLLNVNSDCVVLSVISSMVNLPDYILEMIINSHTTYYLKKYC